MHRSNKSITISSGDQRDKVHAKLVNSTMKNELPKNKLLLIISDVTASVALLYHHVTATYDTDYANHITSITQQLDGGNAVTDYEYDRYGNITQKTLPANSKGQRMWYRYRYEPVMNMYPERVDDARGLQ